MFIRIWDLFFTRKVWVLISKEYLFDDTREKIGYAILLQDQFGNIKKKKVTY